MYIVHYTVLKGKKFSFLFFFFAINKIQNMGEFTGQTTKFLNKCIA